jgi:hypothetical protein
MKRNGRLARKVKLNKPCVSGSWSARALDRQPHFARSFHDQCRHLLRGCFLSQTISFNFFSLDHHHLAGLEWVRLLACLPSRFRSHLRLARAPVRLSRPGGHRSAALTTDWGPRTAPSPAREKCADIWGNEFSYQLSHRTTAGGSGMSDRQTKS